MKFLLTLVLLTVPYQNWSRGDVYQFRATRLIDCKVRKANFQKCVERERREGMSQRDLRMALRDVEAATK